MANAFEVDGLSYTEMDTVAHTVYVSAANKDIEGDIILPEKITYEDVEYSVTAVGSFAKCDKIVSVVIPNSVTNIFGSSFKWCSELTSVQLPNTIKKIPDQLFNQCSKLASVTIPDSVILIEKEAFKGCLSLTLLIPKTVNTIQNGAFYHVKTIVYSGSAQGSPWQAYRHIWGNFIDDDFVYMDETKEDLVGYIKADSHVVIPETVKTIGSDAFRDSKEIVSITIPSSVDSIGSGAFYNCSGLTSVSVPETVTSIGDTAFYGIDTVYYGYRGPAQGSPWGAKWHIRGYFVDGDFAYSDDTKVRLSEYLGMDTFVVIPETVKTIGLNAFRDNKGIVSVTIPPSVEFVESNAFYNCSGIISLSIPETVAVIGDSAFYGIDTVYYGGSAQGTPWGAERHIRGYFVDGDFVYSDDTKEKVVEYIGTDTLVVIPKTVKTIGFNAFRDNKGIVSVTIPSSVDSIGRNAFYNCSGLTSVIIPESVSAIGDSAFYGIDTIYYGYGGSAEGSPWGAKYLVRGNYYEGDFVYADETKEKLIGYVGTDSVVVIPEYVKIIGDDAFRDHTELISVMIPDSVTQIGQNAFRNCSKLSPLTIPESVEYILNNAFAGIDFVVYNGAAQGSSWGAKKHIKGILSETGFVYSDETKETLTGYIGIDSIIVIPEYVKTIDGGAFHENTTVVSVTIPNSVTDICGSAFKWCTNLTSVTLPNSLKKISDQLFSQCYNLESVVIPDSVTLIEKDAFKDCRNMVSVTISKSVTSIGTSAFYGCTSLTSVALPDSLRGIVSSLFDGCTNLESVTIPNTVTYIEQRAFRDCQKLSPVYIPETVRRIEGNAFAGIDTIVYAGDAYGSLWGAKHLLRGTVYDGDFIYVDEAKEKLAGYVGTDSIVVIPDNVKAIYIDAFHNHKGIVSVTIPNSVTYIGNNVFRGCSSLNSLEIPNSVTHIGSTAFAECSSLTSIEIPESVTYLGDGALANNHLKKISIPSSDILLNSLECFSSWFNDSDLSDGEFFNEYGNAYYIGNAENPYLILMKTKTKDVSSIKIHPRCRVIYEFSFRDCQGRYLYLPDSLIGIGACAFHDNYIAAIRVPSSLKWGDCECWFFDKTTFVLDTPEALNDSNSNIRDILRLQYYSDLRLGTIKGDFVYSLDGKTIAAYIGKSTSVTIPDTVRSIGWYAFYGCKDLTSVYIPASVEQMEWDVFKGCTAMTKQGSTGLSDTTISNAIYCRAEELPVGWGDRWNPDSCKVVWGALSAPNSVGFRLVSSTANARIYGAEHSIVIENATSEVYVYTISGQLITRETSIQPITVIPMNKGVYTVKMGDMTKVVIVR